ncbi:MAG: hypothetical protein GC164_16460 [Phycisphaera sp.]|nr:hypothetical protein [Phycisphaera sp.]
MLDKIAPGSKINVKIVKAPTSARATKTLVKLLSKDAAVKKDNARLRAARKKNLAYGNRGGRQWAINVPKQRPVTGKIGEAGTFLATLDVLTELKSVERFVEVSKA